MSIAQTLSNKLLSKDLRNLSSITKPKGIKNISVFTVSFRFFKLDYSIESSITLLL